MHDKYAYEAFEMALHDKEVGAETSQLVWLAYLLLPIHLSAIKYAKSNTCMMQNQV